MSQLAEKIQNLILAKKVGIPTIAEIDALLVDNLRQLLPYNSPAYIVISDPGMTKEAIESAMASVNPPIRKADAEEINAMRISMQKATLEKIEETLNGFSITPIGRICGWLEHERKVTYRKMDEPLRVDSLTLIRLVAFIEQDLGIRIEDEELQAGNFYTLNDIQKLIESKTAKDDEYISVSKGNREP